MGCYELSTNTLPEDDRFHSCPIFGIRYSSSNLAGLQQWSVCVMLYDLLTHLVEADKLFDREIAGSVPGYHLRNELSDNSSQRKLEPSHPIESLPVRGSHRLERCQGEPFLTI